MNSQEAAVAFHAAAHSAFFLVLSGPMARHYKARMMRPQIGDMVIEISSFRGDDPDATGRLLMANPDAGVWQILKFDGGVAHWENAEFVAAPTTMAERRDFTEVRP
jgi:hypothetical protein